MCVCTDWLSNELGLPQYGGRAGGEEGGEEWGRPRRRWANCWRMYLYSNLFVCVCVCTLPLLDEIWGRPAPVRLRVRKVRCGGQHCVRGASHRNEDLALPICYRGTNTGLGTHLRLRRRLCTHDCNHMFGDGVCGFIVFRSALVFSINTENKHHRLTKPPPSGSPPGLWRNRPGWNPICKSANDQWATNFPEFFSLFLSAWKKNTGHFKDNINVSTVLWKKNRTQIGKIVMWVTEWPSMRAALMRPDKCLLQR